MRRCGVLLAVLVVAGCGGGEQPKPLSAAEIDAAHTRWREQVDEVCFEVNRKIGHRGGAKEVAGIERVVTRAVEDLRAGIREIVAVRLPPGGSRAPAAFVRELKAFDAEIAALPEDAKPTALVAAADRVRPMLRKLTVRAGQAHLTNCLTHEERDLVPDSVRGPIFIEQIQRHHRRFIERIPDYDGPATTPEQLAERMDTVGRLFQRAGAHAARFDSTHDARKPAQVYRASLRRAVAVLGRFESFLLHEVPSPTAPAELKRHQRAFTRCWREMARAYDRMWWRAGVPQPAGKGAIDAQVI